jgi:protocatechuate 3,4-dioxygenase beta subunit
MAMLGRQEAEMVDRMDPTRRRLLRAGLVALGLGATSAPLPAWAQRLLRTAPQTRGPFYPVELPLDRDNDLVTVAGGSGVARGELANVVGRVLDESGRPVRQARVEIWQCDANGRYRHPGDRGDVPLDPNFQGYGQTVAAEDGAYRFRTIKPVAYSGRAPHIHFAISGPGFEPLVTQLYVAGAPENARDFVLNGVRDPRARQQLVVPFERAAGSPELLARWDIVLAGDGRLGRAGAEYARVRRT